MLRLCYLTLWSTFTIKERVREREREKDQRILFSLVQLNSMEHLHNKRASERKREREKYQRILFSLVQLNSMEHLHNKRRVREREIEISVFSSVSFTCSLTKLALKLIFLFKFTLLLCIFTG